MPAPLQITISMVFPLLLAANTLIVLPKANHNAVHKHSIQAVRMRNNGFAFIMLLTNVVSLLGVTCRENPRFLRRR